jgi:hypothetical protein
MMENSFIIYHVDDDKACVGDLQKHVFNIPKAFPIVKKIQIKNE